MIGQQNGEREKKIVQKSPVQLAEINESIFLAHFLGNINSKITYKPMSQFYFPRVLCFHPHELFNP